MTGLPLMPAAEQPPPAPHATAMRRSPRVRARRGRRRRSAPRPSSVGTPIAAVKLPSEPPPVDPSSSSRPRRRPRCDARAKSRPTAGRTFQRRPLESASDIQTRAAPAGLQPAQRRLDAGRRSRSSARGRRSARAPPRRRRSAASRRDDADVDADPHGRDPAGARPQQSDPRARGWRSRPCRDRAPACAATPVIVNSNSPQPLRAVLSAPPGNAGSSTRTARAWLASLSMIVREVPLPISSSVVQSITTGGCACTGGFQRLDGERRDPDSRFHVERARTVET